MPVEHEIAQEFNHESSGVEMSENFRRGEESTQKKWKSALFTLDRRYAFAIRISDYDNRYT